MIKNSLNQTYFSSFILTMRKVLSLLIKPSSSVCNLNCEYCFYHDESKHREMASHGFMSKETAMALIDKAILEASEQINFAFQGGEPTLSGLDFFKFFVDYCNKKNTKRLKIDYAMQTNGVLLNEKWAQFLADNKFLVGLSFDGDSSEQNKHRVNYQGEETFSILKNTIQLLKEYKVEFNILSVITSSNCHQTKEMHDFIVRNKIDYIQFIPCLNPLYSKGNYPYSLSDEQYLKFLMEMFDYYYDDFEKGNYFSVRIFDNFFHMLLGNGAEQCGMTGSCTVQFVVEGNGDVYPCDFYCLDNFCIGNLLKDSFIEMENSKVASEFLDNRCEAPQCRYCRIRTYCNAGCPRYYEDGQYKYCNALKQFIPYALPKLKKMKTIIIKKYR